MRALRPGPESLCCNTGCVGATQVGSLETLRLRTFPWGRLVGEVPGSQQAEGTGAEVVLPAQLVITSVGYKCEPLPGIVLDQRSAPSHLPLLLGPPLTLRGRNPPEKLRQAVAESCG